MSAADVADFYVHTASVQKFLGQSGYGVDQYAAAVSKVGFLDGSSKLIRDKTGQQVVSSASWFTDVADLDLYALDSLVSVNNVVNRRVIAVAFHDSGDLDLPDHLEVNLL